MDAETPRDVALAEDLRKRRATEALDAAAGGAGGAGARGSADAEGGGRGGQQGEPGSGGRMDAAAAVRRQSHASEVEVDETAGGLEMAYSLPDEPTAKDWLLFMPRAVSLYVRRLCAAFGWKYVFMVFAVYAFSQGCGETAGYLARRFYWQDNVGLEPADAVAYTAVTHTPWNCKPAYGALSDNVPIAGLHRAPYIAASGLLGIVTYLIIWAVPLSQYVAVTVLFLVNLSMATPDVMIDATVAERARDHPHFASDLQSLCWGSLCIGGLLGCSTAGFIIQASGARLVFGILILSALAIFLPAVFGFLPERKLPLAERHNACACIQFKKHTGVMTLSIVVATLAIILAIVVITNDSDVTRGITTLCIAAAVSYSVYTVLSKIHPAIGKAALFIFLRDCAQPNIEDAWFQWLSSAPNGPHFSAPFISFLDCAAYVAMLAGIMIYNRYMTEWPFRRIFTFAQLFLVFTNALDLLLVLRVNRALYIPDHVFVLGDSALTPLARRFFNMPMFVLASAVCPYGVEAALFAMLMALSNFGQDVGNYFGSFLLWIFDVRRDHFGNLAWVIFIRALMRFVPILLIPILVPKGTPQEPILPPEVAEGDGEDFDEEEDDDYDDVDGTGQRRRRANTDRDALLELPSVHGHRTGGGADMRPLDGTGGHGHGSDGGVGGDDSADVDSDRPGTTKSGRAMIPTESDSPFGSPQPPHTDASGSSTGDQELEAFGRCSDPRDGPDDAVSVSNVVAGVFANEQQPREMADADDVALVQATADASPEGML